jgi:2-C-methyl-D-erythritol 4-phosphate cytidylyltransferase/2-C-methyl-D-erythritol 2,4-cyclodiphosphate synthase
MVATDLTVALVVAAGRGTRAGSDLPKQFRRIGGKAVLRWAVEPFLAHPRVDAVRIVIAAGQEAMAAEAVQGLDVGEPILGAEARAYSVIEGLEALPPGTVRVLIHDAARPFCPAPVIDRLLDALERHHGAVPVLPVSDTLGRSVGDATLGEAIDREGMVRIQTPQAFQLETLTSAYQDWRATPPTDEAAYLRAKRVPIAIVDGDIALAKLTYEADFLDAEARLASRLVTRTGMGFDVHAFEPGDGLWLGGVRIPHNRSLKGHSDADVLLHAVADAILGALGEGDIGNHFPPGDPKWKGASSSLFIEHVRALAERRGGRIDHVDATIVCEAPRIGPHRDAMRARLADLLRVPGSRISIKATTTERLGFTGRGEGIACQAVATLRLPEEDL